ncbi:MAG: trypsin-like peptidase domain-containing protein [Ardenticatenaceae bacterium]|nr:trypsin-like peptidase domain-containing protein [Ardenticatenaceae bacterium]
MSNRSLIAIVAALAVVFLCACVGIASVAYFAVAPAQTATLPNLFGPVARPAPPAPPERPAAQATPARQELPAPEPAATPLSGSELAMLQAEEHAVNNVYQRVSPSVVNISVEANSEDPLSGGLGSGFVWDREGHIVTNNHVVAGAAQIVVHFSDLTEVTAEVVGTDPDSDLAVIKVDVPQSVLQPVEAGSSSDLFVGQRVIAIGNPFGFDRTVTAGIVSAVGRTIQQETRFSLPNLIQTDAAINPGNSGGPLLDIQGRLVGVSTLIFSQTPQANSGVGFAIPVDTVKSVVPQLIEKGSYQHPYIGILTISLTPSVAEQCNIQGGDRGVLIQTVVEDSPAARAGLRGGTQDCQVSGFSQPVQAGGDLIVRIDDVTVESFDDLVNYLDTKQVGDTVTLGLIRDGQPTTVDVTLGPRPPTAPQG